MLNSLSLNNISTDYLPQTFSGNIQVAVLRLDKIHPQVSGNKWFKLRFYLDRAMREGYAGIATFGGAWSNHLLATAAACAASGLQSIGIVRGEAPASYSPTLQQVTALGMELRFIPRDRYRKKNPGEDIPRGFLLVPEGGAGPEGIAGAATIAELIEDDFTHICCAAGTGTMTKGLVQAMAGSEILAVSVLKNYRTLDDELTALYPDSDRWKVCHDYHFGGYAKHTDELLRHMNTFFQDTGIPSDFVYTGKLFYAVNDLIKRGYFPAGSRILMIHSGGLQGNSSLAKGSLIF